MARAKKEKKMGKLLSKAEIWKAEDVQFRVVEIPEWGGSVRLRTLTGDQAALFIDMDKEERAMLMPRLVALAVVDEEGNRIFEEADVARLQAKSMRPLTRVVNVINEMNGFDAKARGDAKNDSGGTELSASSSA